MAWISYSDSIRKASMVKQPAVGTGVIVQWTFSNSDFKIEDAEKVKNQKVQDYIKIKANTQTDLIGSIIDIQNLEAERSRIIGLIGMRHYMGLQLEISFFQDILLKERHLIIIPSYTDVDGIDFPEYINLYIENNINYGASPWNRITLEIKQGGTPPVNGLDVLYVPDTFSLGRLWIGNKFDVVIDAGWSVSWVDNNIVNRTVGGALDVQKRYVYRQLKIKSSGTHAAQPDIYNQNPFKESFEYPTWNECIKQSSHYDECIVNYRNHLSEMNPYITVVVGSGDVHMQPSTTTIYGSLKQSQGIKHISGQNFLIDMTIDEHL